MAECTDNIAIEERGEGATPLEQLFRGLAEIERNDRLFPKVCRTCGKTYDDFPALVRSTVPKRHVLQDCSDVMDRPYTMMYRHCACGNTLVITLTDEHTAELERLWRVLRRKAEESGAGLQEVVSDFVRRWDRYILNGDNSDRRI